MKLIAGVISLLLVAVISGSASGEENPTPEEIVTVTDEESIIIITEIPSCPFITDEEWLKQYIPTDETCTDFVEVESLGD